jgi:GntR family transcriptional regulator, transcriptional repressor for pyruvate dehydrogenase complex
MNPPIPLRASASASAETLAVLGPVARSSVVDAVADRLRGEILAGRLPAGSRLPSERELALALGVNRLTLRAALARLEALGLVVTRHGASTLVTSWRERAGLDSLAALIGSLQPSDQAWFDMAVSLLELRRILATEAVALAAVRHTPEQIEAIERFAAEQKTRLDDPIAYARGEFAFERLIIRATGNIALELVLNMFARFPDDHPEVVAALYDQRDDAALFYDLILGLIRGGDPARARDQMRRAFEIIDADWMRRHRPAEPARPAPEAEVEAETAGRKPARSETKPRKRANRSKKR